MRAPGAVTPITHACEVRRRCVDFVARHQCGERLQFRAFPRKIRAGEADGWLGANAEKLAVQTKTSRRCAPGGTGGLTRPATKNGATIESAQRPHRSSQRVQIAGTQVTLQRAIFTGGVCSVSQGDVRSRLRGKARAHGTRSQQTLVRERPYHRQETGCGEKPRCKPRPRCW